MPVRDISYEFRKDKFAKIFWKAPEKNPGPIDHYWIQLDYSIFAKVPGFANQINIQQLSLLEKGISRIVIWAENEAGNGTRKIYKNVSY